MYAVIVTGGKQYKVSEGDTLFVEKIEAEEGSAVTFDQVLMVGEGEDVKVQISLKELRLKTGKGKENGSRYAGAQHFRDIGTAADAAYGIEVGFEWLHCRKEPSLLHCP